MTGLGMGIAGDPEQGKVYDGTVVQRSWISARS